MYIWLITPNGSLPDCGDRGASDFIVGALKTYTVPVQSDSITILYYEYSPEWPNRRNK